MKNKFKRIWLQDAAEYSDITWCEDKTDDSDIEYILADLHRGELAVLEARAEAAEAELAVLRAENEQLRGALNEAITAIQGLIGIITPKQASRFPNNMARAQKVLIGKKDGGE